MVWIAMEGKRRIHEIQKKYSFLKKMNLACIRYSCLISCIWYQTVLNVCHSLATKKERRILVFLQVCLSAMRISFMKSVQIAHCVKKRHHVPFTHSTRWILFSLRSFRRFSAFYSHRIPTYHTLPCKLSYERPFFLYELTLYGLVQCTWCTTLSVCTCEMRKKPESERKRKTLNIWKEGKCSNNVNTQSEIDVEWQCINIVFGFLSKQLCCTVFSVQNW